MNNLYTNPNMESHGHIVFAAATALLMSQLLQLPQYTTAARKNNGNADLISTRCSLTTYPPLCRASLSSYTNKEQLSPNQLAQAAVSVSIDHARNALAAVSGMAGSAELEASETAVLNDCLMTLGDSVRQLQKSLDEMGGAKVWMDDARTWVSTALTDQNMCADELDGVSLGGKKEAVRGMVVRVAMLSSNALALISSTDSAIGTPAFKLLD